jgi:hypothetical protein
MRCRTAGTPPGTDVMILKYIRQKHRRKNWHFWSKTKLNYAKFWS